MPASDTHQMAKRSFAKHKSPVPVAAARPVTPRLPAEWGDQLQQAIRKDVPTTLAIAIVGLADGACLAGWISLATGSLAQVATHAAELMRQQMAALGGDPASRVPHEVIVTTSNQYHLLHPIDEQARWFVFLAIPREDTNLALARELLSNHVAQLFNQ